MEKVDNIKQKAISGFFWQLAQKLLGQTISFTISVVLARLLMPEDFGIIALSSMFMLLINVVLTGGLHLSLVQKKDADEKDFSTIYVAGLGFAILIYTIIFFSAPYVAIAFGNQLVCPVLRVLGLNAVIGSLSGVQGAYISRYLQFKKFFYVSLIGQILSAFVGLVMAFNNCGVWALVGQNMTSTISSTIVLSIIVPWHPQLQFYWSRFKTMYAFAWKQMVATIVATVSNQMRGYAIGLKYSASDLAYYNRGDGMPQVLYSQIFLTLKSVMMPAMARMQDDVGAVKNALGRSMKLSSYTLTPALLGIAAMSDNLVLAIYTEKWIMAVPYMQMICIMYCFLLLGNMNVEVLTALGRTDIVMRLEVCKSTAMLSILAFTMFISPLAIAAGQTIYAIGACLFNMWPNKKILNYSIQQQFKDVGKNILMAVIMAVVVLLIGFIPINLYILIVLQLVIGVSLYWVMSVAFHNDCYYYIKEIIYKKFRL